MEYTVKGLAELSGVTPRALRWYDRLGLLKPGRTTEEALAVLVRAAPAVRRNLPAGERHRREAHCIRQVRYRPGIPVT